MCGRPRVHSQQLIRKLDVIVIQQFGESIQLGAVIRDVHPLCKRKRSDGEYPSARRRTDRHSNGSNKLANNRNKPVFMAASSPMLFRLNLAAGWPSGLQTAFDMLLIAVSLLGTAGKSNYCLCLSHAYPQTKRSDECTNCGQDGARSLRDIGISRPLVDIKRDACQLDVYAL